MKIQTYIKIRNKAILAAALLMVLATFMACATDDESFDLPTSNDSSAGLLFAGKCEMSDSATTLTCNDVSVMVFSDCIHLLKFPNGMLSSLVSDKAKKDLNYAYTGESLNYDMVSYSDAAMLFDFRSFGYSVVIPNGDGTYSGYSFIFVKYADGISKSWGNLSKDGVLTLILNSEGYYYDCDVDDDSPEGKYVKHPIKITLVLTKYGEK